VSDDRFWKLRDDIRSECEALEAWARTELITDDGFAQSCVLAAVDDIRKVLRKASRGGVA
jgi:hypothetical protein